MVQPSCLNNCDSSIGSNEHGTRVAIYDATNSTKERRAWIAHSCSNDNVLFIELVCRDEALVEETLRTHKIDSPDYANCRDADQAVADFRKRIAHYATFYESIDVREGISFVRAVDLGAKMEMHRMNDGCLLVRRIAYFLACTAGAIGPKSLFLTRHGGERAECAGKDRRGRRVERGRMGVCKETCRVCAGALVHIGHLDEHVQADSPDSLNPP